MISKRVNLLVLLFISFCSFAQIDRSKVPLSEPAPKINIGIPISFKLNNGLTVLVYPNHKLPKVTATLQIDNPPKLLKEDKGVDELLSRMLGNGSANISKDAFNEEIDFYGASLYFWDKGARLNTLSEYFPRLLQLMAEGAIYPNFNESDFEREKSSFLANLKLNEKNVRSVSRNVQRVLLFGKNHPFGEITKEENIDNISLDKVKKYYDNNFKPNNAYLVIVGDVDIKDVKKMVVKLFSNWQSGVVAKAKLPEINNAINTEIDFVNMPNAVQSEITVSNVLNLKMSSPDYFAALLANKILGGGSSARLYGNLREKHGYTYGAYSRISSNRYVGNFKAMASVRNAVTDSAIVQFMDELNKIRDYKVSEQDLENAKADYVGIFIMAIENPETIARFVLNIKKENLPNDFYTTYLQKINGVTINDVQLAAKKYIRSKNSKIIVVGKGLDVIYKLEKLPYKISYFNKFGNLTTKPDFSKPIPSGITVDSVFTSYFNAIGGREKMKNIKGIVIISKATIHDVNIEIEEKRMVPNKYSKSIIIMGKRIVKTVFNKDKAFQFNGDENRKEYFKGDQLLKIKNDVSIFPELLYISKSPILTKIFAINGKYAYEVKVNEGLDVYYDVKSGLKVKQVEFGTLSNGKNYSISKYFSNYKLVGGLKFPFDISLNVSHQKFNYKVTSLTINSNVTEDDF